MDSVVQGYTGAIEDNQQYPDPSDVPGEEKPTD
jgi:hypothetical protein